MVRPCQTHVRNISSDQRFGNSAEATVVGAGEVCGEPGGDYAVTGRMNLVLVLLHSPEPV